MSGKEYVSSQDIPAVFRALGTLVLAVAMTVAIKWFILRDTKGENEKDNEAEQQRNQDSVEDGEYPGNGPKVSYDVPGNNAQVPQVSGGVEIKVTFLSDDSQLTGISRGFQYTSSPSQINSDVQENSNQTAININCDITNDSRQLGDLTQRNSVAPRYSLLKSAVAEMNMPPILSGSVDIKANDTQGYISSDSHTHRSDVPYFERSQNSQEQVSGSKRKSDNGECINNMELESPGCQQELIGYENMGVFGSFFQHRTVNLSLPGDTFNMDTYEKVRVLNFDSNLSMVNHTKYSVKKKYNIWSSIMGKNDYIISIDEGGDHRITCAPCAFESEGSIITKTGKPISSQFSHEVLIESENTTQLTIHPKFQIEKHLEYPFELSDVKRSTTKLSTAKHNVVSTDECSKDISQHETFHYKLDTNFTYRHKSNMCQDIHLMDGKIKEEEHEQPKTSNESLILDFIHDVGQDITDKENNETGNRLFFSTAMTLSDIHNEPCKEITPVTDQIASSHNQNKLLQAPECVVIKCSDGNKINSTFGHHNNNVLQWSTTTVYNSTEHTDLMYPSGHSVNLLKEKNGHQHYAKDNTLFAQSKKISKHLFGNLSFERTLKDLDADVRNSNNSAYDDSKCLKRHMNKPETFVWDPSTHDTFNSQVVTKTKFISTVKSQTSDNKEYHSCHKHEIQNITPKECSAVTNGCLSSSHNTPDESSVCSSSKIYKQRDNDGKTQSHHIFKPLSVILHNSMLQNKQSASWMHSYVSNNNSNTIQTIMGTHGTEPEQGTVPLNQETNIFKRSVSEGSIEQMFDAVDALLIPYESKENNNIDRMYLGTSATCLEQDQQNDLICHNSIRSPEKDKLLPSNNINQLCPEKADGISRKHIMSTIAEHPELILPEYQSVLIPEKKIPVMTKSCDNIHSRSSCQGLKLKNKAQSMLCLLSEYYGSKLHSLDNGPVEEVARGSFVCIPKGLQFIDETKRFQLTLGNCLQLLKLARKNSVPELLKAVYTVISDNYLNVLKNSSIYGHLTGLEREQILQLRTRGKSSLCVVETLSIFNLNTNIRCSVESDQVQSKSKLYSLDMETNQWKEVTTIPEEACLKGCSICSMHNYLFIAGGIQQTNEGSVCSNKLFCYNPLTDIWTQLTSMTQARSQLKLIPLDGYLYAIGGECLHTMERYDPRSNKWTFAAPLPKGSFAVAHEAVACGGEIYISGGHLFYRLLKYKPTRDQWEECPFNASKGRSCDMIAVSSILYRFDMNKDSTVNIFKYNTNTKIWSEYTSTFPGSKAPFRCAVLDDTIYCLNRETTVQFSVENGKAMFEPAIFSAVPTRAISYPCPVVLNLRGSMSQTSV